MVKTKNVKIMVSLKYLSIFKFLFKYLRTLEKLLINFEIKLILTWFKFEKNN